ncbi:hypothetical protein TSOC_001721 [Tetrabaena socialis]|uniref:Uncharacterized protein n=1 Tax=Tetrabaena socialis TaxID=47790 RepID=A0A2J8AFZ6_9CHLO|nr:hypothetical protein TSOC_001721 [Tetrabaena socialis]|eukprot:PNH11445.1 hypothetical protein TSOC_001721 [Tetrabaena socialis]
MADAESAPQFAFDPFPSDEHLQRGSHKAYTADASPCTLSMRDVLGDPAASSKLQLRVMTALAQAPAEHYPRTTATIQALCAALRAHGLDSRLVAPAQPAGGVRCGRSSTGGGGRCAVAAGGSGCFFCSRQPYVLVLPPPPHHLAPALSPSPCLEAEMVAGPGAAAACDAEQATAQSAAGAAALAAAAAAELEADAPVLVELHLRELFRVAPATCEYSAAVEQLPQVWVGPVAALLELAGSVCGAMALNFRVQGLDVPPWRRRSAVLARWDERSTQHAFMSESEGSAHHVPGQHLTAAGHFRPSINGAVSPAAASEQALLPAWMRADSCPLLAATPHTATSAGTAPLHGAAPGSSGTALPPARTQEGVQKCAVPCDLAATGFGPTLQGPSQEPKVIVYGFDLLNAAHAV